MFSGNTRLNTIRSICALFLAAATVLGTQASAQSTVSPTPDDHQELVALNMRDADIRAVIQWIAEQTKRQIVIDPRVQGRVTAFAEQPMTVDQAYRVFLSLLEVQGYSVSDI